MLLRHMRSWATLLITLTLSLVMVRLAQAETPTAHAVLFFSPSCPHCHYVMDEVLPPLQARYGEQLAIQLIDVSQPEGQAIYQGAIRAFMIPDTRLGVPAMIFDTTVMVGSDEIPRYLPDLIDAALAAGGNQWPAIPGFVPPSDGVPTSPSNPLPPFQRDPVANTLALLILVGMVVVVVVVVRSVQAPYNRPLKGRRVWIVPALILVGLVIASYLAIIEVRGSTAVCGPVGDCNTVQQSPYARLFGVLPMGVLGVVGYVAMLLAWAVGQYGTGQIVRYANLALPTMALLGTLFSIYLTFLEPFVIGASCIWCLSSALIMTALLWLTAPRGKPPVVRGRPRQRLAH
ncbi:MAG: vitamin K epoxide reductase family protein [Oscillochloridaceae bacterium umkhey_bin13]